MPLDLNSAAFSLFLIKENDAFAEKKRGGNLKSNFMVKKGVFIKQKKYCLLYPRYLLNS
jgi:hypothetical protein